MTKMTLGLQNHWRMTNSGVGIMPRYLTLAEIRSNTLIGRRRGWHYKRGQYSGGVLYMNFDLLLVQYYDLFRCFDTNFIFGEDLAINYFADFSISD